VITNNPVIDISKRVIYIFANVRGAISTLDLPRTTAIVVWFEIFFTYITSEQELQFYER